MLADFLERVNLHMGRKRAKPWRVKRAGGDQNQRVRPRVVTKVLQIEEEGVGIALPIPQAEIEA